MQHGRPRTNRIHIRKITKAHRGQVAMAECCALGQTRRTAGIEKPRRVVGSAIHYRVWP